MRTPPGRTGPRIQSDLWGTAQAVARPAAWWANSRELTDTSSDGEGIHVYWGMLSQPRPRREGFGCPVRDGPGGQVRAGARAQSHR